MQEEMRQERIEAYLKGSLTSAEKARFEAEIDSDPNLAAEVQSHKAAEVAIEHLRRNDLKLKLKGIDQELDQMQSGAISQKARVMPMYQRLAVAASVVLVVGFALSIIFNPSLDSPQALATEYHTQIDIDRMRSGQPVESDDWRTQLLLAEDLFNEGDYRGAAGIYLDLSDDQLIHQEKIQWNLLMSYIASEQYSKASALLDLVLSDPDHGFYEQAGEIKKKLGNRLED